MGDSSAAGDDPLVDVSEGVATLTLNRPAQHNALSRTLREELAATLTRLAADDRVGVVVLTGAGDKAFCAGADLKEMEHDPLKPEELGPEAPLAWGLLLDVVPPGELMARCLGIARDILGCDPHALRDVRDAIAHGLGTSLEEGLAFEGDLARRSMARFDVAAFLARRAATLSRGKVQASKQKPCA